MKTKDSKLSKTLFPILLPSAKEKERLIEKNRMIDALLDAGNEVPQELRKDSVHRLTIMHGPKKCNFSCPKYCYTEGMRYTDRTPIEFLAEGQLKEVIDQAIELGIKTTYWPGFGELTLSKEFWNNQEHIHERGIGSVVFTNGSVFCDDELAKKATGMSSSDLFDYAKNLGIHFYVKYWNSDQEKACEMVGAPESKYPYAEIDGHGIPLALAKMLETLPRDKIGVEVMVSRENYDDGIDNILPAIRDLDIYGYIEPVIFSGKAKGRQNELSLSQRQYASLRDIFASGGKYCEKRQSIEMILVGDSLSPGIAIPPRKEDCVIDAGGTVKDIFKIYHNDYFREMRKLANELNGCLCRAYLEGQIK